MKYFIHRHIERFQLWLAFRLPRWLVMRAAVRLMAHATTGKYENQIVPELTAMDALKRWDDFEK